MDAILKTKIADALTAARALADAMKGLHERMHELPISDGVQAKSVVDTLSDLGNLRDIAEAVGISRNAATTADILIMTGLSAGTITGASAFLETARAAIKAGYVAAFEAFLCQACKASAEAKESTRPTSPGGTA